jgi:hypothetical protein
MLSFISSTLFDKGDWDTYFYNFGERKYTVARSAEWVTRAIFPPTLIQAVTIHFFSLESADVQYVVYYLRMNNSV